MKYHDKEGKNKDEENKTKFNKKAGTYASQFTDWSSQLTRLNAIGATQFSRARQEQQRRCRRVGQNTFSYETGRMVSSASEGNCDVLNDEVILHIIMYISYLQSYLWWFFTRIINNFE